MRNIYINDRVEHNINAYFKARDDVTNIIKNIDGFKIITFKNSKDSKLAILSERIPTIISTLLKFRNKDNIYFNYPLGRIYLKYFTFLKKTKKVKLIPIIHDLDSLRTNGILNESFLKLCDTIICHNEKMKESLFRELDIAKQKIVTLDIFDYLSDKNTVPHCAGTSNSVDMVIFTGNLSPEKSGFIYQDLPDVNLELWGGGYKTSSVGGRYIGSFESHDPSKLRDHYRNKNILGLVWDGPATDSCKGSLGEYLKYNNPHKTSFYLSLGIPVAIWGQAALADFVRKNNCGICIDSIEQLGATFISHVDYQEIKNNALKISSEINNGSYLTKAIIKANQILNASYK